MLRHNRNGNATRNTKHMFFHRTVANVRVLREAELFLGRVTQNIVFSLEWSDNSKQRVGRSCEGIGLRRLTKPLKTSARAVGVLTEMQTVYISNQSHKRYHWAYMLWRAANRHPLSNNKIHCSAGRGRYCDFIRTHSRRWIDYGTRSPDTTYTALSWS
jgi:hypothetical protein